MTRLSVPDMSCDHCKSSVLSALSSLPDSGMVTVDLDRGEVTVAGKTPAADLLGALSKIGFSAEVIALP